MKTPVCGLCGEEIAERPVSIVGVFIEHQDCREARDILDRVAYNMRRFADAAALARAEAAERRVTELESQLADQRWRKSGEEMPGAGEVEIRATGWYADGSGWYIYLDGDLVDSFPASPCVRWRPVDSDDDPADDYPPV